MSECTHDCSSCSSSDCESRSFIEKPNKLSRIGKVIGIVSGKGGVGKTLVSSMLAVNMKKTGKNVGILDADVTGPSIPKAFGIHQRAEGTDDGLIPVKSKGGIDVMSINLLLENDTDPVIWRGPVIGGVVKQFWTDVIWKDIDCLFVDMPPGTGDVPLTVFQSLPVDGIVIVTSPQDLVKMIVKKAYNMAETMKIPVLGVIENYSYLKCPDCGKEIPVFGKSKIDEVAKDMGVLVLGKMPIDPKLTELSDEGEFAKAENPYLDNAIQALQLLNVKGNE